MTKVTQKEMVFYKLYIERVKDPERYVPTWEFGGEMFIKELNEWVLMSYKCPTRLTELIQDNPSLIERDVIKGKSGAEYYGYRFKEGCSMDDISDQSLKDFYRLIKNHAPS